MPRTLRTHWSATEQWCARSGLRAEQWRHTATEPSRARLMMGRCRAATEGGRLPSSTATISAPESANSGGTGSGKVAMVLMYDHTISPARMW